MGDLWRTGWPEARRPRRSPPPTHDDPIRRTVTWLYFQATWLSLCRCAQVRLPLRHGTAASGVRIPRMAAGVPSTCLPCPPRHLGYRAEPVTNTGVAVQSWQHFCRRWHRRCTCPMVSYRNGNTRRGGAGCERRESRDQEPPDTSGTSTRQVTRREMARCFPPAVRRRCGGMYFSTQSTALCKASCGPSGGPQLAGKSEDCRSSEKSGRERSSQPGIKRLALQRHHTEGALIGTSERLPAHKSLQAFNSWRELRPP